MFVQQQAFGGNTLGTIPPASNLSNWLDIQNKILETFESFITDFQFNVDFYFKTYNKNLKENIEMQIKASKKERIKYMQFLNHEEKAYWKEFPRKKHFYHANLRKIYQLFQQGKSQSSQRDISLIISGILNMMPIASQKYCKKFEIEPIFHQDLENKNTFDTLTESLKMFDSDDLSNWRILGFSVSLMVSDIIQVFLEQVSNDRDIKLSSGVIDILLDISKYFTMVQVIQEEGIEEESIFEVFFKQIQTNWAKVFGNLSRLHFDKCMKFLMNSLQQDFRKLREEEIEYHAQRIHFCRFLYIKPTDKLMASHVQILFDNFITIMSSKSITQQMKNVLLITLKYLVEQLNFSGQDFNFDSPIGILWPTIEGLYKLAVKYTKKEFYKDYAYQLLIIILPIYQFKFLIMIVKIGPNDFYNLHLSKLLKREKIQSLFETKKTYPQGLNLMTELSLGLPLITNKYQDWKPKVHSNSFILVDNQAIGVYLPMKMFKRTYRFRLPRKMSSIEQLPFTFRDSFKFIFNPKLEDMLKFISISYLIFFKQIIIHYSCHLSYIA